MHERPLRAVGCLGSHCFQAFRLSVAPAGGEGILPLHYPEWGEGGRAVGLLLRSLLVRSLEMVASHWSRAGEEETGNLSVKAETPALGTSKVAGRLLQGSVEKPWNLWRERVKSHGIWRGACIRVTI